MLDKILSVWYNSHMDPIAKLTAASASSQPRSSKTGRWVAAQVQNDPTRTDIVTAPSQTEIARVMPEGLPYSRDHEVGRVFADPRNGSVTAKLFIDQRHPTTYRAEVKGSARSSGVRDRSTITLHQDPIRAMRFIDHEFARRGGLWNPEVFK